VNEPDEAGAGLHRYPPFDAVLARLETLPRKQHRIARALLDEPELIAFGSIREVAARLDVNVATVMRFAQVVGYSGYQSLQAAVRQAYLQYAGLQAPVEERLLRHAGGVLGQLHGRQRLELDRLYDALDEPHLEQLCDDLVGARRVIVVGDGAAADVAALFARLLRGAGVVADAVGVGPDVELALVGADDETVVVGLTRGSGEVLRTARASGARTSSLAQLPAGTTVALVALVELLVEAVQAAMKRTSASI
jgi:DNA-binding MurR/RpiR family transcriptional regulator